MNMTLTYSRLHAAMTAAGREAGVGPFTVRVLLAVHEHHEQHGTAPDTGDLEQMLGGEGSAIRRALIDAYDRGLAIGVGPDGGRRKRGSRTRVTLDEAGERVVRAALAHLAAGG